MGALYSRCTPSSSRRGTSSNAGGGNGNGLKTTSSSRYASASGIIPDSSSISCLPLLHRDAVLGVCCVESNDGSTFVTASEDKTACLWSLSSGILQRFKGHERPVNRVAYSRRSSLFVTGSRDTTVKVWRAESSDAKATLTGHTLTVNGVAASDSHDWIASGSRDYTVRFWDPEAGRQTAGKKISRNLVTFLRAIPSENAVLQSSEDLQLRVWDVRTCSVTQSLTGHANIPRCCDVSPDGNYFLSSANGFEGAGCEGRVWDRRTGKQIATLTGHMFSSDGCCFLSPPGIQQLLAATVSADKSVKLWDAMSGACLDTASFTGDDSNDTPVVCVSSCDDDGTGGARLVAGNFEGSVKAWSVRPGSGGLSLSATHATAT
ncbi:WD repeat-containing protein 31 [Pycnococcus provasolii]